MQLFHAKHYPYFLGNSCPLNQEKGPEQENLTFFIQ